MTDQINQEDVTKGSEEGQQSYTPEVYEKNSPPKWVFVLVAVVVVVFATGFWMATKEKPAEELAPVEPVVTTEPEGDIYYLGVLPLSNPSEMLKQFSGVEEYLREETGLNIKLRLYPTSGDLGGYSAVVRDVVADELVGTLTHKRVDKIVRGSWGECRSWDIR